MNLGWLTGGFQRPLVSDLWTPRQVQTQRSKIFPWHFWTAVRHFVLYLVRTDSLQILLEPQILALWCWQQKHCSLLVLVWAPNFFTARISQGFPSPMTTLNSPLHLCCCSFQGVWWKRNTFNISCFVLYRYVYTYWSVPCLFLLLCVIFFHGEKESSMKGN